MDMTRRATCLCIWLLLLTGCQPSASKVPITDETSPDKIAQIPDEKQVIPFTLPEAIFDRVVGWLSNQEVLYITRKQQEFQLHAYNIETGKSRSVLAISDPILEVRIHPDLTRIAAVTSSNSLSATIHIFSITGEKVDELTIESSEMYWDWNSNQASQIFFSAFYEDWSFDSFVYTGETKELNRVDTTDPFGKWGHNSIINVINWLEADSLKGGTIREIDSETMSVKDLQGIHTIYKEANKEGDVTVSISDNQQTFIYTLANIKEGGTSTFELPSISNYSQWSIPEIEWLSDGSLITYEASESGLIDSISSVYKLVRLSRDGNKTLLMEGAYQPFTCAPSGNQCLIGVQLEEMLMVESGEVIPWIDIKE